jgi:hypothetical protein
MNRRLRMLKEDDEKIAANTADALAQNFGQQPTTKYTVVGYHDSTGELFITHVETPSAVDAPKAAYEIMKTPITDPDDFILVEIFEGHLTSVREDCHTCAFSDWPGLV